ncbi:MAG TPA: hypothetical protein VMZ50_09165 [Phycisphaerae bacterium]|nr:hypothetical protein [Phycisphaerae bacterium]
MNEKERIREQLSAYLDAELNEGDAERVARAAEADPHVAAEIEQLSDVRRLVRSLPRERAPKGFVSDVLATVERGRLVETAAAEPSGGALRWVRYLATAAVLLVFVGIAAVVTAVLWKTSDYQFDPGPGRGPTGPIAITEGAGRTALPGPAKSGDLDTLVRGKGGGIVSRDHARGLSGSSELAFALAKKEEIWTDDLHLTEQEVERLCAANGIGALGRTPRGRFVESERAYKNGRGGGGHPVANAYFFQVRRPDPDQWQIVVVAPTDRARQVLAGVETVRAKQRVPQRASALAAGPPPRSETEARTKGIADDLHRFATRLVDGLDGLCGRNHIASNVDQPRHKGDVGYEAEEARCDLREAGQVATKPAGTELFDGKKAAARRGPAPSESPGGRKEDMPGTPGQKARQSEPRQRQSVLIITLNRRDAFPVATGAPTSQPAAKLEPAATQKSATAEEARPTEAK